MSRRPLLALRATAVLLLALPPALEASCQTIFCRQQYAAHEQRREAELRRELAAGGGSPERWSELLRLLQYKRQREELLARYAAAYAWEPQPFLQGDPEPALRRERLAWLAAWRLDDPKAAQPWCQEAQEQGDPPERVAFLRRAVELVPDNFELHLCLAAALTEAGAPEEAVAVLTALGERRAPEPVAMRALAMQLWQLGRKAELRQVLEESARRFPDAPETRRELLVFYALEGLVAEVDALLAKIAAGGAGIQERSSACSSLSGAGRQELAAACAAAVLADFAHAPLSEQERSLLRSARDTVLMNAIHARDHAALARLLVEWPVESLVEPWARIADWHKKEGGCAKLREAFTSGVFAPTLAGPEGRQQGVHLAAALERCGEKSLADQVARPAVAGTDDEAVALSWIPAGREELQRRVRQEPGNVRLLAALDEAMRSAPPAEREPHLRAWAAADRAAVEPAWRLAEVLAATGREKEAVDWFEEAARRRPEDLDLRLRAGAQALALAAEAAAEAAARAVLAGAANPRQQAEAHYLLGRVALRAGRGEEASGLLARYFLARLRYTGCCGAAACDRGLVLHLLAGRDLAALERYRAERRASLAAFEAEHRPGNGLLGLPDGPCAQPELDSELAKGDPEAAFDDVALLAYAEALTAVR